MRFVLLSSLVWLLAAPAMATTATAVRLETVRSEAVADRVEALGTLRANEAVELTVNVSEIVDVIRFDSGQRVKKGDVLVEMASAEERALLQEAQYTLEEASSQLERIRSLIARGDASKSVFDERLREYNVARARVQGIESRLADRRVTAPFDGVLGLRNISPGTYVAAGDVITTLIDDSRMKLDFSVPSVFLQTLTQGMSITAQARAFPDSAFTGTVESIDNRIDPVSRTITIRAVLPNDSGVLRPGLLMEVDLLTRERTALVIPELALVPQGQRQFVFVAMPGEGNQLLAEQRLVSVGSRWLGKVEITSGLQVGERVVSHGTVKVRDQMLIRVLDDIPPGEVR